MDKDDEQFMQDFIKERKWKNSVKYEKFLPHEYTIRQWKIDGSKDFDKFIMLLWQHGTARPFASKMWIYLTIGKYEYFTHPKPLHRIDVINRALPSGD